MTEELMSSEIQQLPESLKQEVLHFAQFLRQEKTRRLENKSNTKERVFGISKGRYKLAPDFDTPLADFKDYM
ncbi:type II toxin-antitoxin system VapB family antitoxin [Persicitalea jodogahamensis]|uniref:DUF2281 domain-containing protein n=1 Tax=Persicitalea jodogahamensis TaxID=402147 RepID=A0A8J3D194_9BACT|nr:DUF2281 domain-containing protein [Persicitalea jodogahamensis]GHB55210.1 hypothetical protein GCM10007390_05500 [Persicitalea jodogahamensis]